MTRLKNVFASLLPALATLCVANSAVAAPLPQQKSQEELAELRDEKMADPAFQNAAWTFDYDKALASAKEQGKLIFAYFTRSYAP